MKMGLLLILSVVHMGVAHAQFSDNRQLLIFGFGEAANLVSQQVAWLQKDSVGIQERDIAIQVVKKNSPLLKKYSIQENNFTVILIGKDGGEKHRTNALLSPQALFALIDVMPMRKAEMKRKQ